MSTDLSAAQVIAEKVIRETRVCSPTFVVARLGHELAAAGYAVVKLPEPDKVTGDLSAWLNADVYAGAGDSLVLCGNDELFPSGARDRAGALLAAAQAAEAL